MNLQRTINAFATLSAAFNAFYCAVSNLELTFWLMRQRMHHTNVRAWDDLA